MTNGAAGAVYRALLRLYPRHFRDEYGADMARLFADQLEDEHAARVCIRAALDLAITVPTCHLEANVNRPPSPVIPVLFAGVGLTGLSVAVVGGSSIGMLTVGLSVAVLATVLAAVAWRHSQPLAMSQPATAHWWKFLTGGAAVLVAVIVATTATGEVDDSMWWPMMITVAGSLMLLGTGLVLGVAHRAGNRLGNA